MRNGDVFFIFYLSGKLHDLCLANQFSSKKNLNLDTSLRIVCSKIELKNCKIELKFLYFTGFYLIPIHAGNKHVKLPDFGITRPL